MIAPGARVRAATSGVATAVMSPAREVSLRVASAGRPRAATPAAVDPEVADVDGDGVGSGQDGPAIPPSSMRTIRALVVWASSPANTFHDSQDVVSSSTSTVTSRARTGEVFVPGATAWRRSAPSSRACRPWSARSEVRTQHTARSRLPSATRPAWACEGRTRCPRARAIPEVSAARSGGLQAIGIALGAVLTGVAPALIGAVLFGATFLGVATTALAIGTRLGFPRAVALLTGATPQARSSARRSSPPAAPRLPRRPAGGLGRRPRRSGRGDPAPVLRSPLNRCRAGGRVRLGPQRSSPPCG